MAGLMAVRKGARAPAPGKEQTGFPTKVLVVTWLFITALLTFTQVGDALAARGKPVPPNWFLAVLIVVVLVAAALVFLEPTWFRDHRKVTQASLLSHLPTRPGLLASVLATLMLAASVQWVFASGVLDSLEPVGKPVETDPHLVAVTIPDAVEVTNEAERGAPVVLLVTQRHTGAQGAQTVETQRFNAMTSSSGDPRIVCVPRGDNEAKLSPVMTALADAIAVRVLPLTAADTGGLSKSATCP